MPKSHVIITRNCCLSRIFVVNRRQAIRRILVLVFVVIFLTLLYNTIYRLLTRDIDIEGWGKNVSRNATNYVHPTRDTSFSHADPNICSERKPLVVVIVCSDTRNWKLRQAIRETWAKNADQYNILVLFLVGVSRSEEINMKTLRESIAHKDIISEEVTDAYNNLTIKSIFMLKWVHKRCMQARFLVKADDDSYINLANLYNYTMRVEQDRMSNFLVGFTQEDPSPHRYHYSKWYIPRYMYPQDKYPTYVQGVCYLMSTQVAERLYFQSFLNDIIHLEDVYITGICAQQINVTAVDDPLFHFYYKPLSIECNSDQTEMIAFGHYVDVYRMYRINHQLSKC